MSTNYNGYALIIGAKGAVGDSCVTMFKENNWWVACVDLCQTFITKEGNTIKRISIPNIVNDEVENFKAANINIAIDPNKELDEQEAEVKEKISKILVGKKLDTIICTAADFAGGNIKDNLSTKVDQMWKKNVWPSVLSATIAAEHLKEGGLLCLSGATAALEGTPDMVAYGLAKAAIHQLTKSLASEGSALPANSICIALLPLTIDTIVNSDFVPTKDISAWTPSKYITDSLLKWSIGTERPENGSLIQFITKNFTTDINFIKM